MDIGYRSCELCPRRCGADRTRGELGWCRCGDELRLAFGGLHFGEEPPLSEPGGSGTLFFSGCPLGCPTCQNIQISSRRDSLGKGISEKELADLCLDLQNRGAENINLVTGTHYIPSLAAVLHDAKQRGLEIPIVWNSSGYERPEALELIHSLIDIYLVDLKTLNFETAGRFCGHPMYPEAAEDTLRWVISHTPADYHNGRLVKGVILRHLLFPHELASTREVLRWFSLNGGDALLSLMQQFIDPLGVLKADREAEGDLLDMLDEFGIQKGFIQELGDDELWMPDFNRLNPFPETFCKPVWNWNG